jgi:hypothetical protein
MDIHKYYSSRLCEVLRQEDVREHMKRVAQLRARVAVLDFCGKTMLMHRYFSGVDIYIVYDAAQCKEEILSVIEENDCVYVLENADSLGENVVYKNSPECCIFLLFDNFRFLGIARDLQDRAAHLQTRDPHQRMFA